MNHFLLFPIGFSCHARINRNTFFIVHSNVKGILSPPFDLCIQSIITWYIKVGGLHDEPLLCLALSLDAKQEFRSICQNMCSLVVLSDAHSRLLNIIVPYFACMTYLFDLTKPSPNILVPSNQNWYMRDFLGIFCMVVPEPFQRQFQK